MLISGGLFDTDAKEKEINDLENLMNKPDFWDDAKKSNEISTKLSYLKKETNSLKDIENRILSTTDLISLLECEDDENLLKEIERETISLEAEINNLELNIYLNGEYDSLNCYMDIHPGAGGTESCDWAMMLLNMYQKYCTKKGFSIEIIDEQKGEEAGIKSATLLIKGINAYGYLKCEKGVHRLIRISPFDSNHRRHTSFASITLTPEFDENIEVVIKESDLKIDVYRSSGAGGQHVNTTDSAVRITHLPTKLVVTCQNERSQIKNKEQALKILKSKIYQLELEKQNENIAKIQGENANIDFGSQIRTYTLEPFTLVKDVRSKYETSNADAILNGEIDEIIESVLKMKEA